MHFLKITLLSLQAMLMSTATSQDAEVEKGFRLLGESSAKNFSLLSEAPSITYLAGYISRINTGVSTEDALEISQNIVKVSECFKIDPWVLTGLIQKESSFQKDAVSATNAVGLTQFTSHGLREVNDQLGIRGLKGGTEAATTYFNTQILECINPEWVQLWTKIAVPHTDENFYRLSKEVLKTDIQTAIVYGGILLKTYVIYTSSKTDETPMDQSYFQALQLYNGEPGEARVNYAKKIFSTVKDLYPEPINFDFLD